MQLQIQFLKEEFNAQANKTFCKGVKLGTIDIFLDDYVVLKAKKLQHAKLTEV